MKEISHQLRSIIATAEPLLSQMNHDDTGLKQDPHEWSKKEILGHLIDSAANNHQKFFHTDKLLGSDMDLELYH